MDLPEMAPPPGAGGVRREHTPPAPYRPHPFADIFPEITGPAFDELVEDIRKNGVLEPIVFLDGQVLDGRNRYHAARTAGVEYPRVEYDGDNPLGFVISKNLTRRHLSDSQRQMVAASIAKLPRGANQHTAIAVPSQEQAAALLNVSVDGIQRAKKVQEQGAPELIGAVNAGQVSVSAAAAVATLPKPEQAEVVARGEKEVVQTAKTILGRKAEEKTPEQKQRERESRARIRQMNKENEERREAANARRRDVGDPNLFEMIITQFGDDLSGRRQLRQAGLQQGPDRCGNRRPPIGIDDGNPDQPGVVAGQVPMRPEVAPEPLKAAEFFSGEMLRQ